MIIGAIVVVKATNIPARVVVVRANDTLDVVVKGNPERVNVKRSAVRWPTAHDRDKGATRPGLGFFLGACAAAVLVYAALHLPHKADTLHVTPAPTVSIDFDHAEGYVSLPDCASADMPCVSDDETPGVLAVHTRDARPVPFIANGAAWTDAAGRVMHSGVIDGGTVVDVCPTDVACIKLALSFDGVQRYWVAGV